MKVKSSALRGSGWCARRREHQFTTSVSKDNTPYQYAVTVKTILSDIMYGRLPKTAADLHTRLLNDFAEINYPMEAIRQVKMRDAEKQISRFLGMNGGRGEDRTPVEIEPEDIVIQDIEVTVKPDLLFNDDNEITAAIIRVGKPNMAVGGKHPEEAMELYALMQYAANQLQPGEEKTVTGAYYFLRRADDSVTKAQFSPDFYGANYSAPTGGRNVVKLSQTVRKNFDGSIDPTDADSMYLPLFDEYFEGKTTCSEEDCKTCDFNRLCNYKRAPEYILKTPKQKSFGEIDLSVAQEKIANFRKGVAVVNAGAGAGKTMVICYRITLLLMEGVKPEQIMLVTFTNSAAEEMRDRIQLYCDDAFGVGAIDISQMTITTFNGFCYEIVKKEYQGFGYTAEPLVIDDVERADLIAQVLSRHSVPGLDYRNFDTNMPSCRGALAIASKAFEIIKSRRLTAGDEQTLWDALADSNYTNFITGGTASATELLAAYNVYDDLMRQKNLMEFADQELLVFDILDEDPYYLESFAFQHIVVDEFQDTSKSQIDLIKQLIDTPDFESLVVVGDDSQAIYGFRDTTPEYLIHFEEYIGQPVTEFALIENYRSCGSVIALANAVNALNVNRVMKDLNATREDGNKPIAKGFHTKEDELIWTANEIRKLIDNGAKPEDIAYIAADKYQLLEQGDALTKVGVPWVTLNPEPYLSNSKVQAAIALARAAADPDDTEDLLVWLDAKMDNTMLQQSDVDAEALLDAEKQTMRTLGAAVLPSKFVKMKYLELAESLNTDDDELYEDFLGKLRGKVDFDRILEYVNKFLKYGDAVTYKRNRTYPGVVLVTAHSGKGLEWPTVFVSLSKFQSKTLKRQNDIEEKRRLVFVSFTRARDQLYVTSQYVAFGAKGNQTYNQFFRETVLALGETYDPVDHEYEARMRKAEEEKKAAAAKRRAEAKASKAAAKSATVTPPAIPAGITSLFDEPAD